MRRREFVLSLVFLASGKMAARADDRVSETASAAKHDASGESGLRSADYDLRVDNAIVSAVNYLAARQSADGLWRSTIYAHFKQGDALTPFALRTLAALRDRVPSDKDRTATARRLGIPHLIRMIGPGGEPRGDMPLTYGVYSAANALMALRNDDAAPPDEAQACRGWAAYLRGRQLDEEFGWEPTESRYGGWSYAPDGPRRPPTGTPLGPLAEPNLSATVFAVEALRAAGCPVDDPALRRALAFIEHCQNYQQDGRQHDPDCDDGGFFFVQGDAVRNKAGRCGTDAQHERFASYGSATADGLRGLLACGLPPEHPRVAAALTWLGQNFLPEKQPGPFPRDREAMRNSLYFYYLFSLARAFEAAKVQMLVRPSARIDWARWIADQLVDRQRNDGSWRNPAVEVREDDPLVATPLALEALCICRGVASAKARLDRPVGAR